MIDYVGRDSVTTAKQATRKAEYSLKKKILYTLNAFPIVFTIIYVLNLVMEHASRHH